MKNPFKWAADHIKRLFGHTTEPNIKPVKKPSKMRWFPHGALYQFLAQLDFGAAARKLAKLSKPQLARKELRERTTTHPAPMGKRRLSDIEAFSVAAAAGAVKFNAGRPRHKHKAIGGHKWRKRITRAMRQRADISHARLTALEVPRRKDGNRLGMRKRIEMAGLQTAFLTSTTGE